MIRSQQIRLASVSDATRLAEMSRDHIESDLGWSWMPARIARQIRADDTNVIVADAGREIIGFAVMKYLEADACLYLLCVDPRYRRRGVGTRMMKWLEKTALTCGSGVVYLETRERNTQAQAFYRRLGYRVIGRVPGYYRGRETAVRMAHDLWSEIAIE